MKNNFLTSFANLYAELFLLPGFFGREERLKTIIRYENYQQWLLFPTDLNSHQHQVAAMTRYLVELLGLVDNADFDSLSAIIMAYIHDDHEPFMKAGDFQSADRVHLSDEQGKKLKRDEHRAIGKAITAYPAKICGYPYTELLWDAASRTVTFKSQLVKLADKLAGLGEALHEIASGNEMMLQGVESKRFNKMNVSPIEYYREYFSELDRKLPLLMTEFDKNDFWFLQPLPENDVSLEHYNLWKAAIEEYAPDWERQRLFGS